MLTPQDVRSVQFEKNLRGYRTEDVDRFLDKVEEQLRDDDDIIRDANELLQKANDRADEIENEANEKRLAEEREYDRVRLEVTRFKSDVLNLYRSHVESLSRLPEFQKETAAQDAEQAESLHRKMQNLLPLLKMTTTRQLTAARISGQRMRASSSWTRRPRLLLILSRMSRTTMLFRVSSSASKATP